MIEVMIRCWDSTLTSSDEQDHGDLKPIPETKDAVAVALHQAQETDRAPKVVVAGRGTTAEQILQIAFAQGIKVREDADLAQLLSAVNEDTEIPSGAFAAVAEILIYLYRANGEAPPGHHQDETAADGRSETVLELADALATKWRQDNGAK